jgi:hypothetical protein
MFLTIYFLNFLDIDIPPEASAFEKSMISKVNEYREVTRIREKSMRESYKTQTELARKQDMMMREFITQLKGTNLQRRDLPTYKHKV